MKMVLYLFFAFVLFVYIHNLSASVYGGDVGEFVSAAAVFGVPHPPGYPLFVFLGSIMLRIPIDISPAAKFGLISAFSSFFSVILLFLISKKLTKNYLISLLSSLILAFSYLFWLYAEIAEVFALNSFFALILFYLALLYKETKNKRIFYTLCFIAGLSLTHHQTIVFVFPSLAIIVIDRNIKNLLKLDVVLKSVAFFVIGLLPYLYAPIASYYSPPLNWGDPSTLNNFIRLVTRADYGYAPNDSAFFGQRILVFKYYVSQLIKNVTLPVLFMSLIGAVSLLKNNKCLFLAIMSIIFLSGPLSVLYVSVPIYDNYKAGVIERFYILSIIFIVLLFPFGLVKLSALFDKFLKINLNLKRKLSVLIPLIFFIIPIYLFIYNYPKTNLSTTWMGNHLASDIIFPVEEKAFIFLVGDTPLFNSWYLRYALGQRKDVTIINFGKTEEDVYFQEIKSKLKEKNNKLSEYNLIVKTMKEIAGQNQVYSNMSIQYEDQRKEGRLNWVPEGLLYRLYPRDAKILQEDEFLKKNEDIFAKYRFRKDDYMKLPTRFNATLADIPSYYADGYIGVADYLISKYGNFEKAEKYYNLAVEIYPLKKNSYFGLGYVNLARGDCEKAKKYYEEAISYDPSYKLAYEFLYINYLYCYEDEKSAEKVSKKFKSVFNESVDEEIEKKYKDIEIGNL